MVAYAKPQPLEERRKQKAKRTEIRSRLLVLHLNDGKL